MVTLSNTLTSVLAGNAQFSDPITKVIYTQFSKVLLKLWLVSAAVQGWGEGERCITTLRCERSWEKRSMKRQRCEGREGWEEWWRQHKGESKDRNLQKHC